MAVIYLCCSANLVAQSVKPAYSSFDYEVTREHEIKPHRRIIPHKGVHQGFNQLHLTLTVSTAGDVVDAVADGDHKLLGFWPELKAEVLRWKFRPFEENGRVVTAKVEEYIDLVPPERLPWFHRAAPLLRPDSNVVITLGRTGCFGTCPSYTLSISPGRIEFEGRAFVVASGKHIDTPNRQEVQQLAKRFIDADFYSMDSSYTAAVTDNPTYTLSISIDGQLKKVVDYVGEWVGMPAVITELEDQVDELAHSNLWIEGDKGLVGALKAENFNFDSFEAQAMLKDSANRGRIDTVVDFLREGVPVKPLPGAQTNETHIFPPIEGAGWLEAACTHDDVLRVFIDAGASKNDMDDKNLALAGAARSGNVKAARLLIAYGANPGADLSKLAVTEGRGRLGSPLVYAAESGNPDMVREILSHHPNVETRDREGKTAIFAAGEYRYDDRDGARVECVRLLAQAGANVNARDNGGNTPLHETFLTEVDEELLGLGANVNARNNNGETPIFTAVNDEAIPLFVEHGADLAIRNNKGQTVIEAAKEHGPGRVEILEHVIQQRGKQGASR